MCVCPYILYMCVCPYTLYMCVHIYYMCMCACVCARACLYIFTFYHYCLTAFHAKAGLVRFIIEHNRCLIGCPSYSTVVQRHLCHYGNFPQSLDFPCYERNRDEYLRLERHRVRTVLFVFGPWCKGEEDTKTKTVV